MLVALNLARLLLLMVLPGAAPAELTTFTARVVSVKDGDSLIVERHDVKRTSEVRLAGIDAPELDQPWGAHAHSALRQLIQGKEVRVVVTDRDLYGRIGGRVWQGRTYVNAEMTKSGNAWAFDSYLSDEAIRVGQNEARRAKRGFWALPDPDRLPPATWRTLHPRKGD